MTLQQACAVLHIDEGDNDLLLQTLVDALPGYIETATGLSPSDQADEPLTDAVGGLLLTQWYYADHADDQSLSRTIKSLLMALSIRAGSYQEDAE